MESLYSSDENADSFVQTTVLGSLRNKGSRQADISPVHNFQQYIFTLPRRKLVVAGRLSPGFSGPLSIETVCFMTLLLKYSTICMRGVFSVFNTQPVACWPSKRMVTNIKRNSALTNKIYNIYSLLFRIGRSYSERFQESPETGVKTLGQPIIILSERISGHCLEDILPSDVMVWNPSELRGGLEIDSVSSFVGSFLACSFSMMFLKAVVRLAMKSYYSQKGTVN